MVVKDSKTLTSKIIFTVSFLFIIVFCAIYFIVFEHYKKSLHNEQIDKINLLLNTLSPSVKINLTRKNYKNISEKFKRFIVFNKEVKSIKLINLTNDLLA